MALLRFKSDPDAISLSNERILMRVPTLEDYEIWAELRAKSRAELMPFEPRWARDELSYAAYKNRLRHYAIERKSEHGYAFFIFDKQSEQMVGGVTLSNIRRGAIQSASLGYWTATEHHRKGYMFASLRRLRSFVFHDLALNRLEAATLIHNEASKSLLLKAGFQYEGTARGYYRIAGQWQDHALYALLASDVISTSGQ